MTTYTAQSYRPQAAVNQAAGGGAISMIDPYTVALPKPRRVAVWINGAYWPGTVTAERPDGVAVLSDAGTHYAYAPGQAVTIAEAITRTRTHLDSVEKRRSAAQARRCLDLAEILARQAATINRDLIMLTREGQ